MIYHIDQALTLVLPDVFKATHAGVKRNLRRYNMFVGFIVVLQFSVLCYIFFTPKEIPTRLVLMLDLIARLVMMIIYVATIIGLLNKLKHFPEEAMREELRSIKMQFASLLLGYTVEEAFEFYELVTLKNNFAVACVKTFVVILGFVQPIVHMLYSHHRTFRYINDESEVLVP